MPKAGEIEVRLRRASAASCSMWLVERHIPAIAAKPDTLLTPAHNAAKTEALRELAAILAKAADRKRAGTVFTTNVPRLLVQWFLLSVDQPRARFERAVTFGQHRQGVYRVVVAMRRAAKAQRGAPRSASRREAYLRVAPADNEWRTAPGIARKRHLRRIRREERIDAAHRQWWADVHARGETILTATIAAPKI